MPFPVTADDPGDSGKEFSDKLPDQRYREAVQLELFDPNEFTQEDLPMMQRVLAFLKYLGRSERS